MRAASASRNQRPAQAIRPRHNYDLREEIGWDDLVRTVAQIRDSLPADQQAHLGISTCNYGEYGAIEILGPAYNLPKPIGTTNSEWLRGYPTPPPTTFIVLGLTRSRPTPSSPAAAWPPTTETPKARRTKKASTTPTSSSAGRPASHCPNSGKSTRTSDEAVIAD